MVSGLKRFFRRTTSTYSSILTLPESSRNFRFQLDGVIFVVLVPDRILLQRLGYVRVGFRLLPSDHPNFASAARNAASQDCTAESLSA